MGSGMPEIGSRISLISKADIRYEGNLYSVDPEECTIALSSVQSYGTEDRETNYPVSAQSQVYDYILFRGSDIKDIRVLTTTIPNDPAIVQLSVPPSINESQFQTRTGYPTPPMVPVGSMPNAPGTSRTQSQTFQNTSFSGASSSINLTQSIPKPQNFQNVASEDESRSSTPSAQNVKNLDAPARISTGSSKDEPTNVTQKRQNTYTRDKTQNINRYQQGPKPQYPQRYQQQSRYPQQQQQQPRYMQQQNSQYRDYNRDNQYRNYNEYRDSYGPRQYVQPFRNTQRPDNWVNYGQRRNQNRVGQPGQQQSNYQSTGYQNRKPKNTLKFESDYDFEQANSEFEQMKTQLEFEQVRTQLEKTKLDDSLKMNGDVDSKKEDSGDEAPEEHELENEEKPVFYDKVKSFFDQISYEAIERSKGLTQRMDWKTERKINSETFGSMALRRNSNFRGRPNGSAGGNYYNNYGGRNMSMANNFRGAYRQHINQRRQFNMPNKNHEGNKESRSS